MNEKADKLTLLHTNDIHSHFEEAARIAGFVKEIRREVPEDGLLLLDCGDHLDRVRPETEGSHAAVNRALLEQLRYDAVTLGNNEGLTCTRAQLDRLYHEAPFRIVCANMTDAATGGYPSWLKPSLTIRRAGMTVALLGLTAPYHEYYELLGWHAADPIETAAAWAATMRREADVLVVLSHLGLRQDERLAVAVPGLDLILGAHTHHLLETPLRIGETTICAAGKFGRHVGVVEIARDASNGKLKIEGRCVAMEGRAADPEALSIVAGYREQAREAMSGVLAELAEPLSAEPERENPLATLLAIALRRKTGAEIGLTNAGQLLEGLEAGPVTQARIHAICPSPINACRIILTGGQLRRAIEESLLPEFTSLSFQGYGFRGRVLGRLCFDGLEIAYDESKPAYERIVEARVNGETLDDDRTYAVGTLDMFTFGIGHVGLKEGRTERFYLPEFIRDLLAEELNDPAAVADCRRPRWHPVSASPDPG
ncbi:bifunctional metallophosphatase/5'-nucleotidase [Cohnella nanjingensis]|uniref:Bifunctional metallophosphatase/5'-nucleotidase n=1 Tax=Cohnella nanjingensis TaxID=1387779 RepID=A0A7X0RRG9_9BACL|nr:bifunctional UDP-sugar hydrolase/5'-nucleotidase [Cohnella nanjingensis]MBB6672344.1 bifunctional metallophosphatase/5'-nucleotidase [Cohnella nanjingensis]